MRSTAAFFVLCLTLASSTAFAQTTTGPTIFGTVGLHTLWDEESYIGQGISFGGGASVPIGGRLRIRGRVTRSINERDFGTGVVFERTATRYTAETLWHMTAGSLAPYVGGGIGGFSYKHESTFGPHPQDPRGVGQPVQRFSSSGTELIYGAIGGFTALSRGRFRLQPEASVWLTDGYHIVIEAGILAGWAWD